MTKSKKINNLECGFTLIELLVVAAILGILLAIAIPNLVKARLSANESSARKTLQTLRDAEYEYSEQDMDDNGARDYTNFIGTLGAASTLRDPSGTNDPEDALVDTTFEGAVVNDGNAAAAAICTDPKAGYCIAWSADAANDPVSLQGDFGWEASMTTVGKTGRKDYSVFADKVIKCRVSSQSTGGTGQFEGTRNDPGCD